MTDNNGWIPVDTTTRRYDAMESALIAALQATGYTANMQQGTTGGSGYLYFSADKPDTEDEWAMVTVRQDSEGDLYIIGRKSRIVDADHTLKIEGVYCDRGWQWNVGEVHHW